MRFKLCANDKIGNKNIMQGNWLRWCLILTMTTFQIIACRSEASHFSSSGSENKNAEISQVKSEAEANKAKIVNVDLEKNRALWIKSKILDYDIVCSIFAGAATVPAYPVLIKVRDGKAVSIEPVKKPNDGSIEIYKRFDTVDKMFDEIQQGLEKGGSIVVKVKKYNEKFGYPESFSINDIKATDLGIALEIHKFEIIKAN